MSESVKLEKILRKGRKVSIVLSSLAEPLVITEELIYKNNLKEGVVLTPAQVDQLIFESELFRCEETATRLLARRQHSVGELKTKLIQRKYKTETINHILDKFINSGLLDDAQYAFELAGYMVERHPCGKSYLTAYLQRKHIDRALAEQAVAIVFADRDETELAMVALRKRWREFSQFELEAIRQKSYTYLNSRGFSLAVAKTALAQILNEKNEVT